MNLTKNPIELWPSATGHATCEASIEYATPTDGSRDQWRLIIRRLADRDIEESRSEVLKKWQFSASDDARSYWNENRFAVMSKC